MRPLEQLAQIEREIQKPECQQLLEQLKVRWPSYRGYESWSEVVAGLLATRGDPGRDALLRPILRWHHQDNDPRWRTILLVAFGPALFWIWRRKASWDPDEFNRWAIVYGAFLDTLCVFDPDEITTRLDSNIFRRTLYGIHNHYRRSWRRQRHFVPLEEVLRQDDEGGSEMEPANQVDPLTEGNRLLESLIWHGLSSTDALIIIGTRVYGDTLSEIAGDLGLTSEAAKKRRQRAEAWLRQRLR